MLNAKITLAFLPHSSYPCYPGVSLTTVVTLSVKSLIYKVQACVNVSTTNWDGLVIQAGRYGKESLKNIMSIGMLIR